MMKKLIDKFNGIVKKIFLKVPLLFRVATEEPSLRSSIILTNHEAYLVLADTESPSVK